MPRNWNILKLRQQLRAWNLPRLTLNPRQRRVAWMVGGGVGLALLIMGVIRPLMGLEAHWGRELARKQQLLGRYQALTAGKERLGQDFEDLKAARDHMESRFLTGANTAVAAADLLEILKQLTGSLEVQLTSTKVLPPRETGPYQEVRVQVQLPGTMEQLLNLIYHLEHHPKLLSIPEMDVLAPKAPPKGNGEPVMQVNLVVAGTMKKKPGI